MCYHIGLFPLGGRLIVIGHLYFTKKLKEIFYFGNRNAVFIRFLVFRKPILLLINWDSICRNALLMNKQKL